MVFSLNNLFRVSAPLTCAFSCSVIYIIGIDYYYKTFPRVKWTTPFKLKYLLNPGLIFAAFLGVRYAYLGEPLIPYLIRKNK
jgi:hypothetical protein